MMPNIEIFFRMHICGTALAQIGRLLLKGAGFVCTKEATKALLFSMLCPSVCPLKSYDVGVKQLLNVQYNLESMYL